MKRFHSVLLIAALVLSLFQPVALSAAENKDTLTWAQGADVTSLDPHIGKETPAVMATNQIFDTLFTTDDENSGSVRRFQNLLAALGIEDALRRAGVENGDTVMIGDAFELEWVD